MFHPFRVSVRVRFTLSVALLCIASAAAGTPGVRLSWNHCAGEGTGAHNAVFACASNLGSHTMIGSFVLDSDFPTVIGVEVFIDLATASAALPPWWDLRGGSGCRSTSRAGGPGWPRRGSAGPLPVFGYARSSRDC